ncbi:hypothetical protein [Streptomyces rhizosphaericus]|uniref:hypothetical protein n=1 Tax=Streptomyces rhizosphaericus TaxID=114699 RepID=UPI000A3D34F6|nr:hypothetical protein [Streptomyces rhizosphaericus]
MTTPPDNLDGQYPEHGAAFLVWWDKENHRMHLKDRAYACTDCPSHVKEITVRAVLMDETDLPFVPAGAPVWQVAAGAPDAQGAHDAARTVAKALGWSMNPLLSPEGATS